MTTEFLDRNLALEAVRITEAAALSSSLHMGRGDEKAADQAAVNAMREFLNNLSISGTIIIGEGERDKAPMLYIGEKVGLGGPKVDIALDPFAVIVVPSKGSRAISTFGPPNPTFSPIYSIGALSRSPSPIIIVPLIDRLLRNSRIALTAA
jgi:hypothetical protein